MSDLRWVEARSFHSFHISVMMHLVVAPVIAGLVISIIFVKWYGVLPRSAFGHYHRPGCSKHR